jgi:plasmid stabilization system protein ParE
MKPFILTPRAAQDVSDIWDYIADDSIEAADRVLEALEKAMYICRKTPESDTCVKNWPTAATASFWSIPT